MNWLTKAQTERIRQDLHQQGVQSPDLADDLLDHICFAVEREMEAGLAFEEAYEKVRTTAFTAAELRTVQAQTVALLAGKAIYYPGLGQSLGLLVLYGLLAFLGNRFMAALMGGLGLSLSYLYALNLVLFTGALLLTIAYARHELLRISVAKVDLFPLNSVPRGVYPVLTLLMLCGCFWTELLRGWLPMPASVQNVLLETIRQSSYFPLALGMVVVGPLLTEVLFRGIVLKGLLQKYAPARAICLSAFFYAVSLLNPWGFPGYFLLGLLTGWLFYKTRSLLPGLYAHVVLGLIGLVVVGLVAPSAGALADLTWRNMLGNDPLYYGLMTVSLLITGLLLRWLQKHLTALALTR